MTAGRLRLVTNVPTIHSPLADRVEHVTVSPPARTVRAELRYLLSAAREWMRADVVFFDCDHAQLLRWCVVAWLLPWSKCKLACGDLNLARPVTARDWLLVLLKRVLLRQVDLFMLLQHDFTEYVRYYGLPRARLRHVPFKVNLLKETQALTPTEGDYYWAGGLTYRDWPTLSRAVANTKLSVVLTFPSDDELRSRQVPGHVPSRESLAENIRIVRHGADPRTWLEVVAGSRGIVLPIHPRSINPSGVSTYLTAMALGKPVVITEGASTRGLLDERTAIVVPPGDPDALRAALLRLDADPDLRRRLGQAALAHARAAGDASRLHTDYLRHLFALVPEHGVPEAASGAARPWHGGSPPT